MARPAKSMSPDLSVASDLTAGLIERLTCPAGKSQGFLRDGKVPGLRVRVTMAGAKSFVFEAKLNRQTIRVTIGDVRTWAIEAARVEARHLAVLIDRGIDPRELDRQRIAAKVAEQAAEASNAITVGQAWARYLVERQPHWGERHYLDHVKLSDPGGRDRARLPGTQTKAGPLASLMVMRLVDLDTGMIETWAATEAKGRPTRVRLALRLMKAFLRWAADEPDLKDKADPKAASAKKVRELVGKAKSKNDHLQREQLQTWFAHVRQIPNPVISAYLQCLLLTGARREELGKLRWDEVNFQWRSMSLRDKIEGQREIPLTSYVASLITALPRRNEWVFSSDSSESGRLTEPSIAHRRACAAAGLSLSLHGLRRSFASLCEWLEIPGGISAQIQGHAPQGVREQNYIRRPIDLLRVHHERIEEWMLVEANVPFDRTAARGKLVAVA